ncbi:glycosyltransferase [Leucobacter sp. cx-328]|uniref:glycosyltransferase family protein n=1 Tax=unclassified Leucobacter TaxID=2621730 RepID=UPI00165E61D3|nr:MULTISPECIES: glycosyltransferase [unclassified Leucobacter]MBC9944646.1 glycosyltransferase [Leucobacter sp. cx-328]
MMKEGGKTVPASKQSMIFHVPYKLNPGATSGSAIRPVRMRQAFEDAGYVVEEIAGDALTRKRKIRALKARIRRGERFEFVYSEASTMPTALTEDHHLPLRPFFDISFLKFCTTHGIPAGVFYRDIYWQYPEYLNSVNRIVAMGTRALYRWDLIRYQSAVSKIFVPSMLMAEKMPHTNILQCTALPPGASYDGDVSAVADTSALLFVGGTGPYYRMEECVRAVEETPGASLVLCTPENLWVQERARYSDLIGTSTEVIHASGNGLDQYFARTAIGSLFLEPIEYRAFAAPLKLYEYLSRGKPVVAVQGSLAAEFVEKHGVGWAIPYSAADLAALLERLKADPAEYAAVHAQVLRVREQHTWKARAEQAAHALIG